MNETFLGVSVDESFAEFSLVKGIKAQKSHRIYLARESLKTGLASFLAANPELKPVKAAISLRFLEKILDYRLGGSVAQLISEGLENWAQIRSARPGQQSLSNPELIFSVRERVSAQGELLHEISDEDLQGIAAKLKLMEVKRVCLHFLHSSRLPTNLDKARAFFEKEGFDVFVPASSENPDEVSRWRANTLNASISGTFLELKEQIEEGCKDILTPDDISYLSSAKKVFRDSKQTRLGSLFSTRAAILENHPQSTDLLYLGLEKFSWISKKTENFWQSPWGKVELEHPRCIDLKIQPTSLIDMNVFGDLDFTSKTESYEPGPMSMGRGQKPTLLDLFGEEEALKNVAGLGDRIAAAGLQRFRGTITALAKSHSQKDAKSMEVASLIKKLRAQAFQRITLEVHMQGGPLTVRVVGPLAGLMGPGLRALSPSWQIESQDFEDSVAVAFAGQNWPPFQPGTL